MTTENVVISRDITFDKNEEWLIPFDFQNTVPQNDKDDDIEVVFNLHDEETSDENLEKIETGEQSVQDMLPSENGELENLPSGAPLSIVTLSSTSDTVVSCSGQVDT